VLRPATGELLRHGACLCLQDRSLQILTLLLSRPGELVTREEVIAHLWPKAVVDYETGINTAMRKLRIALIDDPDAPRYIETVPRKGYRFIGSRRISQGHPSFQRQQGPEESMGVPEWTSWSSRRGCALKDPVVHMLPSVGSIRFARRVCWGDEVPFAGCARPQAASKTSPARVNR
jgi:DNA-binding winged helix-turn-helix (wHTH) protein